MQHKCAACKCETGIEASKETASAASPPNGWFTRCIDETDYILCDVCGDQSHFCGGISPYLMERLSLDDHALCDLSVEIGVLGKARRRNTRRRNAS